MDNTLLGMCHAFLKGILDSLKGIIIIFQLDSKLKEKTELKRKKKEIDSPAPQKTSNVPVQEENKVSKRTIQCCLLNGGVFCGSILLFDHILLPCLLFTLRLILGSSSTYTQFYWTWINLLLSWTFNALWVLPLFTLSKVINSLWFQDIADSAYRYTQGRPHHFTSISKLLADTLFSLLIQSLFLVQTMLVSKLPIYLIADTIGLIHMCLLYSLYAYEYKWYNQGWELHRRLSFIEHNFPYFLGFGLTLAVLTHVCSSYIISGCVFSVLFPLQIIAANEADPVINKSEYQLKLFSPVIAISNAVFNHTIRPAQVKQARR
uniref:Etoposide-induced protein 2.4 homolog n=2 Tax=Cacopsylla melanoneura TaxID=428564 RepID=A0A8D8XFU9_9HEMI